jgi:hypothetical protein
MVDGLDVLALIEFMKKESPDTSQILKQQEMGSISLEQIIQQLINTFSLD